MLNMITLVPVSLHSGYAGKRATVCTCRLTVAGMRASGVLGRCMDKVGIWPDRSTFECEFVNGERSGVAAVLPQALCGACAHTH